MSPLILGLIAVFAPLAAAVVLVLIPALRRQGMPAAIISVGGALASLFASGVLLTRQLANPHHSEIFEVMWLPANGDSVATIGLLLDGVSVPMLAVVAVVASCVQIFSVGYMSAEKPNDFGRYFTWHALFLFTMQGLVVAPNLLQLFACWEMVGLCSYLLIGFYFTKPSAARAAVKAFWVTKLADMGLLLGLILQYVVVGNFGWDDGTVQALVGAGAVNLVAGGYFLAVMGKSAQFPFHVWLPDAMEGPTPVSALLHAATMVAAGVFLIVRAFPIFVAAEYVMPAMAIIGGVTALLAACMAVVQTDIKKVLAYSTCSQLGYMIAALGSGSLMGGYFHLTTHAFFKALLFLAAGSIIHAVHSNEMKDMGGLWRKMPVTTAVFIIGSVALMGLPFLSGFYSKDLILEVLFAGAQQDPLMWIPFAACTITAGLTAYYMGKVLFTVFFGAQTEASSHAHEHGPTIIVPLLLLATLAISAGWAGGQLAHMYGDEEFHFAFAHFTPVGVAGTALALTGLLVAFLLHHRGMFPGVPAALRPVGDFIRSGPVDRAWVLGYQYGLLSISAGAAWVDRYLIDGAINGIGAGTILLGERFRDMQTGHVRDYVHVILMAAIAVAVASQLWFGMGS